MDEALEEMYVSAHGGSLERPARHHTPTPTPAWPCMTGKCLEICPDWDECDARQDAIREAVQAQEESEWEGRR